MQRHIRVVGHLGLLTTLGVGAVCQSISSQAQIVPDRTLGAAASQVLPNVTVAGGQGTQIDGGAVRGANLFHSFSAFDIGESERVYFLNPANIDNIFSRVTGGSSSSILGTLGVDGSANLYFLNPNGIVFGETARLDVAGSFHATTAAGFNWGAGQVFSAVDPAAPPLLIVNVRPGLQPGTGQAMLISRGQLFAGGDLTLSGQKLFLGGQLGAGQDLTIQATTAIAMRDLQADVSNGNNVFLLSQGNLILDNVHISTGIVTSSDSFFSSIRFGTGGNISLYAGKNLDILSSRLMIWSGNRGGSTEGNLTAYARGNMTIASSSISIDRVLSTALASSSNDGSEYISFNSSLFFVSGFNFINAYSSRFNPSSGIAIRGLNLSIDDSYIATSTEVSGAAANISINAQNMTIRDGMIRTSASSYSSSSSITNVVGPAGEIFLAANQLFLNQGNIGTFSEDGGGTVELDVEDQMVMQNFSYISTEVIGDGGDITIDVSDSSLQGGDAKTDSDIVAFKDGEVDISGEVINFGFTNQVVVFGDGQNEIGGVEQDDGSGDGSGDPVPYSSNLSALDDSVEEPELVVRSLCELGQDSNFVVVGRGGLPKTPHNVLSSAATWEDWFTDTSDAISTVSSELDGEFDTESLDEQPRAVTLEQSVLEAQGWQRMADGQVVLVAHSAITNPDSNQLVVQSCRQLQQVVSRGGLSPELDTLTAELPQYSVNW